MKMIHLRCHEVRAKLPAYIQQDLSAMARQNVSQHLEHCVACQEALVDVQLAGRPLEQSLRRFGQPDAPTLQRLWANIQSELAPVPVVRRMPAHQPRYRVGLVAAVLMVMLVLPLSMSRAYGAVNVPTQPKPYSVAVTTPEADTSVQNVVQPTVATIAHTEAGQDTERPNLHNTPAPPQ